MAANPCVILFDQYLIEEPSYTVVFVRAEYFRAYTVVFNSL